MDLLDIQNVTVVGFTLSPDIRLKKNKIVGLSWKGHIYGCVGYQMSKMVFTIAKKVHWTDIQFYIDLVTFTLNRAII